MAFCTECGGEVGEDAKFCRACGASTGVFAAVPAAMKVAHGDGAGNGASRFVRGADAPAEVSASPIAESPAGDAGRSATDEVNGSLAALTSGTPKVDEPRPGGHSPSATGATLPSPDAPTEPLPVTVTRMAPISLPAEPPAPPTIALSSDIGPAGSAASPAENLSVLPKASAPFAGGSRRRPLWHWLAPAALAAALIIGLVLALTSGGDSPPRPAAKPAPTFAQRAAAPLATFTVANQSLSDQGSRLTLGASPKEVSAMLDANLDATRAVQAAITALAPSPSDPLTVPLAAVFAAQQRYLRDAADAVESPSASAARDLQQTADTLDNAYAGLAGRVPGLAAPRGADELDAWVKHRNAVSARRASIGSFISRVDAVLQQSRTGRQKISAVAITIREGDTTVAEARAGISEVIANREAVLASTLALPASTETMRSVRDKLAEAIRRSLDNDRDFQQGIANYENDNYIGFLREVYDESFSSSGAARVAKTAFLSAYNAMRKAQKKSAVPDDF